MSHPIDSMLAAASKAHAAGRLQEAENLANQVLAAQGTNSQAHLLLGVICAKTGRDVDALGHFKLVLERDSFSFEANFWLSILHRRGRNLDEATRYAEEAIKIRPVDAHGLNNLGLCFLDLFRLDEAIDMFRRAGAIRPDLAPIFHNLGTALYLQGNDWAAGMAFERAISLSPQSIDSLLSLGQALISQTKAREAAMVASRALKLAPNSAAAHLLMASALVEDSRPAEAEPHLAKAVELNPEDAQAQALLGLRLQSLGRFNEANERLWKSLELEPKQGFAYFALVHNNKINELDQPVVSKMSALAESEKLAPREMAFLEYSLGRALENLGDYEQALRHFDKANALSRRIKFGDQEFDREEYVRNFDQLIETFTEDFIGRESVVGNGSDLPIAIVGMMRSGTTLVEQILSSHPEVGAGGEQSFWQQSRPRLFNAKSSIFQELGLEYTARLRKVAPGYERITDKAPANYELLGPIHMSFPKAKIIHMRRHPVDTCISIYTTPNRATVPYAYDRDNIVLAYQQYRRLMAHWRKLIPSSQMLEIDYEALVKDRETQIRRMIEFLGLSWNDSLLRHESNLRNVLTPSAWQVRQPIYTSSMDRWRRYERWLGAFGQLIESA